MKRSNLSLNEIRSRGYVALVRALGPTGFVRFIQQFEAGKGDYTVEREKWAVSLTLGQIIAWVKHRSSKKAG